jgi:hypothetical protein
MKTFLASGKISAGANYWASHAGIHMWRDWRPEVIDQDFAKLAASGLDVLRVFPLWPDFQPIHALRKWCGGLVEYRHGEIPFAGPGDDLSDVGEDGVSREMLRRFGVMADLAQKHGISLIVGLITGWMSGRLFVPPGLEGLNPIADPASIKWQVRLIQAVVGCHRDHRAIRAWDLGNECNCLGPATREQAWLWTATLASTIRAADPTRPVISGMHSLQADPAAAWSIRDQGELTDILTTHPYSLFTPHCDREPANTMRPLLHASAETCLYADLSGKPAFVEEFGTLGPMVCGDDVAADMVRVRMFDIWAHDGRAALWWCAHDQTRLDYAPYDWLPVERELGLFRADGSAKPAARAFEGARAAIDALPVKTLPPRRIDAVCLLTEGQDQWGVAYSAFILAKQAGFDVRFHYCDRALPDADLYLLPSVKGHTPLPRRRERELWARVEAGATLYVSLDDGTLGEFVPKAGLQFGGRAERQGGCRFGFAGHDFESHAPLRYQVQPAESAEVLARETDGSPILVKKAHGKGAVYSLLAPIESNLAKQAGAFLPEQSQPFWKIYARVAEAQLARRILKKRSPWIGLTEHELPDGSVIVVAINYAGGEVEDVMTLRGDYVLGATWLGACPVGSGGETHRLKIAAASSCVWLLKPVAVRRAGSSERVRAETAVPAEVTS